MHRVQLQNMLFSWGNYWAPPKKKFDQLFLNEILNLIGMNGVSLQRPKRTRIFKFSNPSTIMVVGLRGAGNGNEMCKK